MLTVILSVRDTGQMAANCLSSLIATFATLRQPGNVEFILVDDNSDPSNGIIELFEKFRRATESRTTIVHFKSRQYYTYACSMGLSLARGGLVLFVSHDMIVTPAYVNALVQATSMDAESGIVRGCSPHVDCFLEHVIVPPLATRSYADVCSFSDYVQRYYGMSLAEDRFLIGDSFLVKRALIDKIGVLDVRYRHLFGDIDFGLRARRAGFKLICAKGAWLHHEGRGHAKGRLAAGATQQDVHDETRELLIASYSLFRERWDASLPPNYPGGVNIDFDRLVKLPTRFAEYVPPLKVESGVCQILG